MFDFDRLKIVSHFIDDMEAIRADLESGRNDLQAHALGRLAAIAAEQANNAATIPNVGARFASLMRDIAADALLEKAEIERCNNIGEQVRKEIARDWRLADLQRERTAAAHKRAGQGELFAPSPQGEEKP